MELHEKKLRQVNSYSGIIVDVTLDQAQLADGSRAFREVVHHPGGVTVLPLDEEGFVYCVRQYRYPFNCQMLEIPAGKREAGEPAFVTARRELQEEIGASAQRWYDLGTVLPSPGCYNEVLCLYMAEGLHFTKQQLDEGEFLTVEKLPFQKLVERCLHGEIADAKTVCATLKVLGFRTLGEKPCLLPTEGV